MSGALQEINCRIPPGRRRGWYDGANYRKSSHCNRAEVVMTMAGAAPSLVYQTTRGSISTPCASRSARVIDQSTSQSIGQYPIGAYNQELFVQSPQVVIYRDIQIKGVDRSCRPRTTRLIGRVITTSSSSESLSSQLIGSRTPNNRETQLPKSMIVGPPHRILTSGALQKINRRIPSG